MLSIVQEWSGTNVGNCPLRRIVRLDRRAIFGHLMRSPDKDPNDTTENWLITQPKIRPNHQSWIIYDITDILQAPGNLVLCCPADLVSQSAMTRNGIRKYGQAQISSKGHHALSSILASPMGQ